MLLGWNAPNRPCLNRDCFSGILDSNPFPALIGIADVRLHCPQAQEGGQKQVRAKQWGVRCVSRLWVETALETRLLSPRANRTSLNLNGKLEAMALQAEEHQEVG